MKVENQKLKEKARCFVAHLRVLYYLRGLQPGVALCRLCTTPPSTPPNAEHGG